MVSTAMSLLSTKPADFYCISVRTSDSKEQIKGRIVNGFRHLSHCRDILILCDQYGSTAGRIAEDLQSNGSQVACVYGLNLAMLLEVINMRDLPLNELVSTAVTVGKEAVSSTLNP